MPLSLAELERRCQKPDHQRIGTWMARHISRPAALRVTWVVAPWGATANMATLAAWACGAGAAVALAWGTLIGWLLAAALLQLWYLLDHVDGQLARLRGTASLDGVQLDYLMHHTVNLLVPLGAGYGLGTQASGPWWPAMGLVWGLALLLVHLQDDARYKAFVLRLKRLRGTLEVCGGGGYRPEPGPPMPRRPMRLAIWLVRKACEMHVIMNLLAAVALGAWLLGDWSLWAGQAWLVLLAAPAVSVAVATLVHSQQRGAAEAEFARWYRVPAGNHLVYSEGWWVVEVSQFSESGRSARDDKI
jgi:hypothetical protein